MATSYTVPITVTLARLPAGFKGTPQEIGDAIAARLRLVSNSPFALFTVGDTEPPYDTGPWAEGGHTWMYFSTSEGRYVPFEVPQERLRWQVSVEEPTLDAIEMWVELDGDSGLPVNIRIRTDADDPADVWQPVYYSKDLVYTKEEVNAIAEAAGLTQRYAVRADSIGSQTVPINTISSPTKLAITNEIFDPGEAFTAADSRYTAKVPGIYSIKITSQFDNDGGNAADMTIGVIVLKNGAGGPNILGATTAVASPPGSRWFVNFGGDVFLQEDEYFDVFAYATDGTHSGDLQAGSISLSVHLVQQTS